MMGNVLADEFMRSRILRVFEQHGPSVPYVTMMRLILARGLATKNADLLELQDKSAISVVPDELDLFYRVFNYLQKAGIIACKFEPGMVLVVSREEHLDLGNVS